MFVVKKIDQFYHVQFAGNTIQHFNCRDNARYLADSLKATLERVKKQIPGRPRSFKQRIKALSALATKERRQLKRFEANAQAKLARLSK